MNPKMIILGIAMFLVLFFLYRLLLGNRTATITNLKYDSTLDPFSFGTLNIPNSTRFSYYIWVYVNNIDPSVDENIFTVSDTDVKTATNSNGDLLRLYIKNTTDLCVDVLLGDTTSTSLNQIFITNNFPLQTWQQVIISFDNTHLDVYHNGKFLKSNHFENTKLPVKTSNKSIINFGTTKSDINIKLFSVLEYPMDPQTAWNKYVDDSKTSNGANTVNYGLKLNVSSNNKPSTPITLF
jgi:hypothetical protein